MRKFWTCFDGENTPPEGGESKTFTQDEVNSFIANKRREWETKATKDAETKQKALLSQLEDLKKTANMTAEQKSALESRIEELQNANLSAEERAKQAKDRSDKEWQTKFESADTQAKTWKQRHDDLKINYELRQAASEAGVTPSNIKFVEALLKQHTRLVEENDEEGKPSGQFTVKIKFQDKTKEGKSFINDLDIGGTLARMKELPDEYGSLFETDKKGGVGTNNGQPGKKTDVKNMGMAAYIKARKENPASVGK